MNERRRKVVEAYRAIGGRELGERALQQHDDTNLSPDEKTIRNEVFLLGSDVDALLRAYVYLPQGPNPAEFEAVMKPLRGALIRHDLHDIENATLTSNLELWSVHASAKSQQTA